MAQIKPTDAEHFAYAIRMHNVNVKYGDRSILQHVNWEVKRGEQWSVSGPNGAGKSTLLSLVTGDNPQAYANEIYLFDRRRGSGESIWDLKRKIGFVSPELHLYFDRSANCFEAVASGLFDSIGLFRPLSEEQRRQVWSWIQLLHLEEVHQKSLSLLPAGKQRLVLLARALVRNPPMLILDEPCQGMDDLQRAEFLSVVEELCRTFQTTLVYVSHYRDEIPSTVNHFLELKNGSIVGKPLLANHNASSLSRPH